MTLKIAVIGTGIMGTDHARLFAEDLPHVELHTICDASEERAKSTADLFGVRNVMTDAFKAVTNPDIDAVVIASPDDTHAPLTIAAIQAGKHVLSEKPLSPSSQECMQVMDVEQRLGRRMVQVGFMRRFDPSYSEMKATLINGTVGQAVMLHCYHRNVTAPANFTGQMAISNSAPHEFDAARFILDEEIAGISVFQPKSTDTTKTGAPVFMVLETASGRLVNVEINNNAHYGYDVRAELVGELGSVFLRAPVHSETHTNLSAKLAYAPDWRPRFAEAYRLQNKAWIQSILTDKPSPVGSSAWDGYCATRISETGVKALASGQRERIELITKPALYC
jgi:myo-inositol 2-dehydrogenase / D-chiro-inositol 1-dehydrogenase